MFREYLLDSSSLRPNRKPWPMAIAFVLECIAAAVVICIPLLSSGVIPVAARVPRIIAPLPVVQVATEPAQGTPSRGQATEPASDRLIVISDNPNRISLPMHTSYDPEAPANFRDVPLGPPKGPVVSCSRCGRSVVPGPGREDKRYIVSQLSPAQLLRRIEPLYPRPAVLMGLQGEVKLHALIAKDGTIQSLSVTSGHPLLAQAALDAVRQWRYRPYVLNGEAVEVETFITVNFRRDH